MDAMKPFALTLLTIACLLLALATQAAEPSPRDLHVARCVAALDSNTQELAGQVRAGQQTPRRMLEDRLVAGAAFIGDSYLHGQRDEQRAKELADRETEAQKQLPAAELAARQDACASEGAKLFAAGNSLQRAVVHRLAKKRMERLLGG
jgi:hypothetical protein